MVVRTYHCCRILAMGRHQNAEGNNNASSPPYSSSEQTLVSCGYYLWGVIVSRIKSHPALLCHPVLHLRSKMSEAVPLHIKERKPKRGQIFRSTIVLFDLSRYDLLWP